MYVSADVRDCSGDGGATLTEPQGGFAHPAVYTMFHPPPPPSTSTSAAAAAASSSLSGGAVAGAVVGSVAGVALAVLAGWWALGRRGEARWRRRRRSVGRSTISELQGNAAEIHEKPAVPVEPAAVYGEPQELEAVERAELPVAGSLVAEKKKKKEGTPSPRQSAFVEHTEEDEEEERRRRDRKDEQGK